MGNHNGMIIEKFVVATIVNVSCLNVFAFIRMWTWVRVCMRAMYNKLLRQTFLQSLHTLLVCVRKPHVWLVTQPHCVRLESGSEGTWSSPSRPTLPCHRMIVESSRPGGVLFSRNHAAFNRQYWTCLSVRNLRLLRQWFPAPHARNTDPVLGVMGLFSSRHFFLLFLDLN